MSYEQLPWKQMSQFPTLVCQVSPIHIIPERNTMCCSFPQLKISMPRYHNKPYSPANNWARCLGLWRNAIKRGSTPWDIAMLLINVCFVPDLGIMHNWLETI